jgi:hypothetical protein
MLLYQLVQTGALSNDQLAEIRHHLATGQMTTDQALRYFGTGRL